MPVLGAGVLPTRSLRSDGEFEPCVTGGPSVTATSNPWASAMVWTM
jgi:hypothetical protein